MVLVQQTRSLVLCKFPAEGGVVNGEVFQRLFLLIIFSCVCANPWLLKAAGVNSCQLWPAVLVFAPDRDQQTGGELKH